MPIDVVVSVITNSNAISNDSINEFLLGLASVVGDIDDRAISNARTGANFDFAYIA